MGAITTCHSMDIDFFKFLHACAAITVVNFTDVYVKQGSNKGWMSFITGVVGPLMLFKDTRLFIV